MLHGTNFNGTKLLQTTENVIVIFYIRSNFMFLSFFELSEDGTKAYCDPQTIGRIFRQSGNELGASMFPARNELSMLLQYTSFPAGN